MTVPSRYGSCVDILPSSPRNDAFPLLPGPLKKSTSESGTIAAAVRQEEAVPIDHAYPGRKESQHNNAIAELRSRFSHSGVLNNVTILEVLRRQYPQHTVVATPADTGIIKFAKAGKATVILDTASDFYASRTFEQPDDDEMTKEARLEETIELGRYDYHWNGHGFQVFVLRYWEMMYTRTTNYFILYPWCLDDVRLGYSNAADSLIQAAATHKNEVKQEIWVYDKGYWSKNRKLWENVQVARWEGIILNEEVKKKLRADVEGFFSSKEDYIRFSVPWKVRPSTAFFLFSF